MKMSLFKDIVLGIDIGGTTCKCGVFTTDGTLVYKDEIPTRKDEGGSLILSDIKEHIPELVKAAAQEILRAAGITNVRIERVSGNLTDHYSPKEGVLRLSDSVYNSTSVAAIGVAAHECGHAMQYDEEYFPIKIRAAVIPIANIGSALSWPIILLGLFLGATGLMQLGVVLFSLVVVFQLLTLPVEFDASARALRTLRERNMLESSELTGARKVLTAAALTYVAALLTSILQLLRLVLLTRRDD